jgi:hypothetical protein
LLLAAAVLSGPAAAQAPDSATAAAGAHFATTGPLGPVARALFGAHHRDLWAAPVTAALIPIAGPGGYRVIGAASLVLAEPALTLEDAGGVRWRFTPLDPQFGSSIALLPAHPAAVHVLQDMVSARHPGAPRVAASLACQAGVAHSAVVLRYLPDTPLLGSFRDRFGGRMGWLTRAPASNGAPITAQELLRTLDQDPALPVDTLAYLQERLFDLLIGEADPIPARAPWVPGTDGRWQPGPRIRWDAFSRYGGLLTFMARPIMPEAATFGPEYARRLGQNPAQFILDARLLAPLRDAVWDSVAGVLAGRLEDQVIAEAVAELPAGWDVGANDLAAALRQRRDRLAEAGSRLRERLRDDPPKESDLTTSSIREALASEEVKPLQGTARTPWIAANINSDLGLFVAAGPSWTTWAPSYSPWQRQVRAQLGFATAANAFRLELQGEFHWPGSARWLRLEGLASGVEVIRFYGYGNETRKDSADVNFYRARQTHYVGGAWIGTQAGAHGEVAAGPVAVHVTTREGATLVNELQPYGTDDFSAVGLRGAFRWDTRDNTVAAHRGVLLDLGGSWYADWLDAVEEFGEVHGGVSTYLTPHPSVTLAARVGGKHAWGEYPLHEAAFLGSRGTMRGLDPNRYAGDAAAWVNTDLRVKTGTVPFLVDWDFGVLGIADGGRVWLEGENSGRWHTGFGGGVWMLLPDRSMAATFSAVRSEGRLGVAMNLKFDF